MQILNKLKYISFLHLKSNYFFFSGLCKFSYKNEFIFFENDTQFVGFFRDINYYSRFKQIYYSSINKNYYIIFSTTYVKNLCMIINKFLKYNFPFYMYRVKVIGLNLKLLLIKKYNSFKLEYKRKNKQVTLKQFCYIRVDLGFSHYLDLRVPFSIYIRKRRRDWIFFGANPGVLKQFLLTLTNIKEVTAYKLRGYPIIGYPHVFKEGKKLFR
jgi:hypothetical protein